MSLVLARSVAKAYKRKAFRLWWLLAGARCAEPRGWPGQARPWRFKDRPRVSLPYSQVVDQL